MRRLFFLLAFLTLGLGPARVDAEPTVILLSWDGVRWDYPERTSLPALERMEREGMRAKRMTPVFPASTFANHVSLATGTYPDRHGIVDNRFWDRERGLYDYGNDANWLEAEPLWAAAERQGVKAATFFWVGSETPWRSQTTHYTKGPFDSGIGEAEKVDQILAWLDLPAPDRPQLIMGWWHGADGAGHRFGPDSPEVTAALRDQDAQLGRLLAGIDARGAWNDVTLIIVSDHGMLAIEDTFSLSGLVEDEGIQARVEERSSVAHIFLESPEDRGRLETRLAQEPGLHTYRPETLPKELRLSHPTRNGDLIVLIDPPRIFRKGEFWTDAYILWRQFWIDQPKFGAHGFDPHHPEMGTVFYALGRGVTPGHSEAEVRTIDVAATVAGLLQIEPPAQNEGRPITGVGGALPANPSPNVTKPLWDQELIDLTHTFDAETIYWPTETGFELTTRSAGMTDKGYYYEAHSLSTPEHGGTHLDAPVHFAQGGDTTDQIPLERLIGPGVLVDVSEASTKNRDYQVGVSDFKAWEEENGRIPKGAIVLLRTGFGGYWPDRKRYMGTDLRGEAGVAALHFPGLDPAAVPFLADRGISAIGLDTPSIDHGPSTHFGAHVALFKHNIPALENVAHLDQLPEHGFTVIALPMKVGQGSGGPLRIVAALP